MEQLIIKQYHKFVKCGKKLGDPEEERQANLDDPDWSLQQEEELGMLAEVGFFTNCSDF